MSKLIREARVRLQSSSSTWRVPGSPNDVRHAYWKRGLGAPAEPRWNDQTRAYLCAAMVLAAVLACILFGLLVAWGSR